MKPGQSLRTSVRRSRLDTAARNWRHLAIGLALYGAATTISILWVLWALPKTVQFAAGVATLGGLWALKELLYCFEPATSRSLGARGEESTGLVLEKARRHGWRSFHGLVFQGESGPFDIDHVSVGPHGVFAIESKYVGDSDWKPSGEVWGQSAKIEQAQRNAQQIARFLGASKINVAVTPVLAIWGPGAARGAQPAWDRGVLILHRPQQTSWLELGAQISDDTRAASVTALETFARAQARYFRSIKKRARRPQARRGATTRRKSCRRSR